MNEFLTYSLTYILLLVYGVFVLRYLVPRNYQKHGKLSRWVTFLQALLFFAYGGFPYVYLDKSWPEVAVPLTLHIIGMVLLFGGLASLLYGMIRLGVLRSMGRDVPQLEKMGFYGLSRNPQALACGLFAIGFLLLWPSWYAAGWAFLYFVLIHMMILAEEGNLSRIHGQKYIDYCRRVPRYIGLRTFKKNRAS